MRERRLPSIRGVALRAALVAAAAPGCAAVHFHDADKERLANEAAERLDKSLGAQTPVFDLMLRNQEVVSAALTERSARLLETRASIFLSALDYASWADVQSSLDAAADGANGFAAYVQEAYVATLKKDADLKKAIGNAKVGVAEADKALKAAREQELDYAARRAALRAALVKFAEKPEFTSETKDALLAAMLKAPLPEWAADKTVGDRIGTDLNKLFDPKAVDAADAFATLKALTLDQFDPKAAPGANVEALAIAADLETAKLERLQAERDFTEDCTATLDKHLSKSKLLAQYAAQLSDFRKATKAKDGFDAADFGFVDAGRPRESINLAARAHQAAAKTASTDDDRVADGAQRAAYQVLAAFVLGETSMNPDLMRLQVDAELASHAHRHSIRMSQVNNKERTLVLTHATGALRKFHAGGITAEDINVLLRGLHAAALTWIGSSVDD